MKRLKFAATCLLTISLLTACNAADSDTKSSDTILIENPTLIETPTSKTVAKDGKVHLRLMTPVAEPRACILPIRIENGLEADVNVTMIGFSLTGPGEDTTGNMFAPVAKSGEFSEARVILEGQSCNAFDTVIPSEIMCKAGEETCAPKVELMDGDSLRFSQAG